MNDEQRRRAKAFYDEFKHGLEPETRKTIEETFFQMGRVVGAGEYLGDGWVHTEIGWLPEDDPALLRPSEADMMCGCQGGGLDPTDDEDGYER